jgi:hypothetical protein
MNREAMKKLTFITVLSFIFSIAQAAEPSLPQLFFTSGDLYDNVACEKTPVDPKWKDELDEKGESFEKMWNEKGPVLFKVIFDHTGLGFSRKELTATLSVCPGKPSFSSPLVFNVTPFLDSFMSPRPTWGENEFVDLVFHELLHSWVVDNLHGSQLRMKYKNELPVVKNHLHLMALQKYVYLKLGKPELVAMIDSHYNAIGGAYARAWEIVNTEGYEAFLSEFPSAE